MVKRYFVTQGEQISVQIYGYEMAEKVARIWAFSGPATIFELSSGRAPEPVAQWSRHADH